MDMNLKYHQQGIHLSLSMLLLFEAAWKVLSYAFGAIFH